MTNARLDNQHAFAAACYADNSIRDLEAMIGEDADRTTMRDWNLTEAEYFAALEEALADKMEDAAAGYVANVKAYMDDNGESIEDLVSEWCNAREVEVTDTGEIWIADPQAGHWLDNASRIAFVQWSEARR